MYLWDLWSFPQWGSLKTVWRNFHQQWLIAWCLKAEFILTTLISTFIVKLSKTWGKYERDESICEILGLQKTFFNIESCKKTFNVYGTFFCKKGSYPGLQEWEKIQHGTKYKVFVLRGRPGWSAASWVAKAKSQADWRKREQEAQTDMPNSSLQTRSTNLLRKIKQKSETMMWNIFTRY